MAMKEVVRLKDIGDKDNDDNYNNNDNAINNNNNRRIFQCHPLYNGIGKNAVLL